MSQLSPDPRRRHQARPAHQRPLARRRRHLCAHQRPGQGPRERRWTRALRHFRTVLLTTGENRIVDESKDVGAATRILGLWGSPFGGESQEIARDISEINDGLAANYGHAGPAFVQYVVEQRVQHDAWRKRHKEIRSAYRAQMPGAIGDRVSEYLATLDLTSQLAHECLALPWERDDIIGQLAHELAESSTTDRADDAREHIYNWAVSNSARFWRHGAEGRINGWLGRWDHSDSELTSERWEWIGFLRGPLEDELRRVGFDAAAILRLWAERGWLASDGDKAASMRVRIDGRLARVVALRRFAE